MKTIPLLKYELTRDKHVLMLFISMLFSIISVAQSLYNSPYSRYGVGDIQSSPFSQSIAMGGLSYGLTSSNSINITNPASYSFLELTTYETGLKTYITKLETSSMKQKTGSAAFSHLAIGVPVTKRWGASFGLLPFSKVGYNITFQEPLGFTDTATYTYKGNGGISRIYLGQSFLIHKNLSVGVNGSYLFGNIFHESKVEFENTSENYNVTSLSNTFIGDIYLNYGIQYSKAFSNDRKFSFGLAGSNSTVISARRVQETKSYELTSLNVMKVKDTISSSDEKGTLNFPLYGGLGFSYEKKNKFLIGGDFQFNQWSGSSQFGENDSLADSWVASIGGMYTPEHDAVDNYLKRITWYGGIRINKTPLYFDRQLDEYSLTLGMSLPLRRIKSRINIAVEFLQRGTTQNDLLKEQTLRLNLGFTFNDKWFLRQKFD